MFCCLCFVVDTSLCSFVRVYLGGVGLAIGYCLVVFDVKRVGSFLVIVLIV